jgi:hypothetical protein
MGFAFVLQHRQQLNDVVPRRDGSRPGKSANKNDHRDDDAMLLHSDYFANDATNTKGISVAIQDEQGPVHEDCARRERVRRQLQVQKRLQWKVGVLVGSEMHGCPTVHCIWSSTRYNCELSMHGRGDIYR